MTVLRGSDRPTVLVTAVGGGAVGHEVMKALRLAPTAYRIVGADVNPTAIGLFECDESYVLPPARSPEYLEAVVELVEAERIIAIAPGSDVELETLSAGRALLAERGAALLANHQSVLDTCFDKQGTIDFLRTHGFAAPLTATLRRENDVEQVTWLPAVMKPMTGGGGSNLVFLAQTRDEVAFFARYIRDSGAVPLAQEYVGGPLDEFTVGVLHSTTGALIGSIALRRNILNALSSRARIPSRSRWRPDETLVVSSGVSQGAIEEAPDVRFACERIASALHSRGPLNVQLRFVDGKPYVFEINPRFSGTSVFRALAGFNEPDLLIRRDVLGQTVEAPEVRYGIAIRALAERLVSVGDERRHHWSDRWAPR